MAIIKVGVYGGYYAVSRVMDAGLAEMGWQTVAWSGGQVYGRAVLLQPGTSCGAPTRMSTCFGMVLLISASVRDHHR